MSMKKYTVKDIPKTERIKKLIEHPAALDERPEQVVEDVD